MDVNAMVDNWKAQFSIDATKRNLDGSDTEVDEELEAERVARDRRRGRMIKAGEDQKEILKGRLGSLRVALRGMIDSLRPFECDASQPQIDSMEWLANHMYNHAQESIGQWAFFIRLISANSSAIESIKNGQFPVYILDYDHLDYDHLGSNILPVYVNARRRMEQNVPELYTFVYETLLAHGFIAVQPQDDEMKAQSDGELPDTDDEDVYPTKNDVKAEDVKDEDDVKDDVNEESSGVDDDVPVPLLYSNLFTEASRTLPNDGNGAKAALLSESHSIFSHSYDYLIPYDQDEIQFPLLRTYFYRSFGAEFQFSTSPANRNADLAAAMRSMMLLSVAIASEARLYAEAGASAALNHVPAGQDPWYDRTVVELCRLHGKMLDLGDDMALEDTNKRMEKYEEFARTNELAVAELHKDFDIRSPQSPLVDLLMRLCDVSFELIGARYAAGLQRENAFLPSTLSPLHMVAFPTPILYAPPSDVDTPDDESVVSVAFPYEPPKDVVDSQETVDDAADSQATIKESESESDDEEPMGHDSL